MDDNIWKRSRTDFSTTVKTLSISFDTWKRLNEDNIITVKKLREAKHHINKHTSYFYDLQNTNHIHKFKNSKGYIYSNHFKSDQCVLVYDLYDVGDMSSCIMAAVIGKSIDHPNIFRYEQSDVKIIQGSIVQFRFLCRLVPYTLQDLYLDRVEFTISDMRLTAYQVSSAVHALHMCGFVHGTVSGSSVLMIDGVAKLSSLKSVYPLWGTQGDNTFDCMHSPPESLLNIQGPCDVWALGILFAEMATRERILTQTWNEKDGKFADDSDIAKYLSTLCNRIGSPSLADIQELGWTLIFTKGTLWEEIENEKLRDLIRKCLQWDRTKRITIEQLLNHPYFRVYKSPVFQKNKLIGKNRMLQYKKDFTLQIIRELKTTTFKNVEIDRAVDIYLELLWNKCRIDSLCFDGIVYLMFLLSKNTVPIYTEHALDTIKEI
jgi:serine/threonine protein kinase